MIKNLPSSYLEFIEECRNKKYETESIHRHHILPKFMGGTDDIDNLIELSVEDHFIVHKILAENVTDEYRCGAYASLNILYRYWSGDYDEIRKQISESVSGRRNGMYDRTHTEEYKDFLRKKMGGCNNFFFGKKHTKKTRDRMSKNHANVSGGNNPASRSCIDFETGEEYECIKDMAISVGVPRTTMNRWVKDNKNTRYKYKNN